jgi:ribosomal protein L23
MKYRYMIISNPTDTTGIFPYKARCCEKICIISMAKKSLVTKPDETKLDAELQGIILGPRITEKAAYSAEKNAYVFNVAPRCKQNSDCSCYQNMYNVNPIKVSVSVKKPMQRYMFAV